MKLFWYDPGRERVNGELDLGPCSPEVRAVVALMITQLDQWGVTNRHSRLVVGASWRIVTRVDEDAEEVATTIEFDFAE